MGEQTRKLWNKSTIVFYMFLAVLMSSGLGYSVRAQQDRETVIELTKLHIKEKVSLRRAAKADRQILADRNVVLVNQIALLAAKANDNTKTAIEQKVEK